MNRLLLMIGSALLLQGCLPEDLTDKGADTEPTYTQTGVVADGYLTGATVCLDLNQNRKCDAGEPVTTSTAGGEYSLEASVEQLAKYNVIVNVVPGVTIDEDAPETPLTKAYTLTAPAGQNAFISPITTLIQGALENDPTLSIEQAEKSLAQILSIEEEELYKDFIADPSLAPVHEVAKVVANALSEAEESFEAGLSGGSNSDFSKEVLMVATEVISDKLTEIVNAVESDSDGTLDQDEINTIVEESVEAEIAKEAETIESTVEQKEILENTTALTPRNSVQEGIFYLELSLEEYWFESDERQDETAVYFEREGVKIDSSTGEQYDMDCSKVWSLQKGDLVVSEPCDWVKWDEYVEDEAYTYTRWSVKDGVLTKSEIEYDTEKYTSTWLDDDTLQHSTDYFLDNVKVDSEVDSINLKMTEISLAGKNVQNSLVSWAKNPTAISEDFTVEIENPEIFSASSTSELFSDDASIYIYSISESSGSLGYFSEYLYVQDKNLSYVESNSLDQLISANVGINADCYIGNDWESCILWLNSSQGATSGNATLQLVDCSEYPCSTKEKVLDTISWTRKETYGSDAIVFNNTKLITDFGVLYEPKEGVFVTQYLDMGGSDSEAYLNNAAANEAQAVIESAISDYLTAQNQTL